MGPWIAIGAKPGDAGVLAVLGLGQAVGVTLFTVGMVGRTDEGPPADEYGSVRVEVSTAAGDTLTVGL